MPIEIKELHIKVNVNQPKEEGSALAPSTAENENDKDALSSQVVDLIMDIIKNKEER